MGLWLPKSIKVCVKSMSSVLCVCFLRLTKLKAWSARACTHTHTHTHTHTPHARAHTHMHPTPTTPPPPSHTHTHTGTHTARACTHTCTQTPPPPPHTHTHIHTHERKVQKHTCKCTATLTAMTQICRQSSLLRAPSAAGPDQVAGVAICFHGTHIASLGMGSFQFALAFPFDQDAARASPCPRRSLSTFSAWRRRTPARRVNVVPTSPRPISAFRHGRGPPRRRSWPCDVSWI